MNDTPVQVFVLRLEIARMKQRLAHSELIQEAEAMGFKFEITLPEDSLIPVGKDEPQ